MDQSRRARYEHSLTETLRVIREWIAEHDYPPSVYDIRDARGYTQTTARRHVRVLIERGLLERDGNRQRALRVVDA